MDGAPCAKCLLSYVSSRAGGSGSRAERNSKSIERVHQADGIGEVSELLVAEFAGDGLIVGIGNAALGHARHGFRPSERRTFTGAEDLPCVAPHGCQHELAYRDA